MSWVFNQFPNGDRPVGFRFEESKKKDGRFNHRYGGKPPAFLYAETGSKKPPLLLATIDLTDPRLTLKIPGVDELPLLYGFLDRGSLQYRPLPGGRVQVSHKEAYKRDPRYRNEWDDIVDAAAKVGFRHIWIKLSKPVLLTEYNIRKEVDPDPIETLEKAYEILGKELPPGGFERLPHDDEDWLDWVTWTNPNHLAAAMGDRRWGDGMPCPNAECDGQLMDVTATIHVGEPIGGLQLWGSYGENEAPVILYSHCPLCHLIDCGAGPHV